MIRTSFPETLNARELYDLTQSPKCESISDHYGEVITISQYAIADEDGVDEKGNPATITKVAIRTEDGVVMATNSKPFVRDFENILGCLAQAGVHAAPHSISIDQRKARKSGRNFSGCTWID